MGSFQFSAGTPDGLIQEETGGGSGYDHPSPSIPLPVEGRGKPVATWPGILGALAASVTGLQTVTCIMGFLRAEYGRRIGGSQWLAGRIHVRIRFWKATARRFGNRDTADLEVCATTLECRCVSRRMVARLQRLMAIMASKPRALPWAVLWRPFRPCIRTAMLEEESHGFSIDGTAQVLRYGRLRSLRYNGLPWFCRLHYPG